MTQTATTPNCHLCQKPVSLRHRKSDKAPFWGCSQYPDCTAIQSMNGRQSAGSPPRRRDQRQREAQNREASRGIAERARINDGCECPFDDIPGMNDIRTAYGPIGAVVEVELVGVADMDSEFRDIVR